MNSFNMLPYTVFFYVSTWTYHSVEMNMEDRDRISIAFNLVDPQQPINNMVRVKNPNAQVHSVFPTPAYVQISDMI